MEEKKKKQSKDPAAVVEEVTAAPMGDPDNETTQEQPPEATPEEEAATDFLSNPAVMEYINNQIAEGIAKALKGTPPKASTVDPTAAERANFERMTYRERIKLYQSNPHSYQKLAKGGN